MINPEVQNLIQTQFKQLPDVVQDVILNSNWQDKIRRIVLNNKLHIDQGAAIENLVFITMLGMERPDDFVHNAQEFAHVSEEKAYNISAEVERDIFAEIRKKLIAITETHDTLSEIDRVADDVSSAAGENVEQKPLTKTEKKPLSEHIPKGTFATENNEDDVLLKVAPPTTYSSEQKKESVATSSNESTKVTPTRQKISSPTETPPKPAFKPIPKIIAPQIDPIVAASLGGPKTSAREILEMEAEENTQKTGAQKFVASNSEPTETEGSVSTNQTYKSSDPYREVVE